MVIDSKISFDEAIKGSEATKKVIEQLELIDLEYYGVDGVLHQGQMMVNKRISEKVKDIFVVILKEKFPINKVVPMSFYNWDDNLSMSDNNSSSFCYRKIAGSDDISLHSFGLAIDINPLFNPLVYIEDRRCVPPLGKYDIKRAGTLVEGSKIVKAFEERGFLWRGRNRQKYDDLQHFDVDK